MKDFDIIIHVGLKDNPVARFLTELGTDIKFISLRQGEFVLSQTVGVKYMKRERFVQKIHDRSIYRYIIELKREFSKPIIIIEGNDSMYQPELDITQFLSAMLFISVLNRIPVLTANNEIETAQLVFMMSAQVGSGLDIEAAIKSKPEVHAGKITPSNGDLRQQIVEAIPEVGPALAEALMKHFGTLKKLFAAKIEDLQKVDGVGPKRARAIHAFLNDRAA
jgi:ERCC4-type nuclease